jgi:hypothetical protein
MIIKLVLKYIEINVDVVNKGILALSNLSGSRFCCVRIAQVKGIDLLLRLFEVYEKKESSVILGCCGTLTNLALCEEINDVISEACYDACCVYIFIPIYLYLCNI